MFKIRKSVMTWNKWITAQHNICAIRKTFLPCNSSWTIGESFMSQKFLVYSTDCPRKVKSRQHDYDFGRKLATKKHPNQMNTGTLNEHPFGFGMRGWGIMVTFTCRIFNLLPCSSIPFDKSACFEKSKEKDNNRFNERTKYKRNYSRGWKKAENYSLKNVYWVI